MLAIFLIGYHKMANLFTTIGNDVVSTYAAGENERPSAWEVEKALQITFKKGS